MPRRPGSPSSRPVGRDELPTVHLRSALDDEDVVAGLRDGSLIRLRRGAYTSASDLSVDSYRRRTQLALARACAVAAQCPSPLVVSHLSAALLWRILLTLPPERVHVTQHFRPRPQKDSGVYRHVSRLDQEEICTIAGIRVTSLARTTVDCLRVLTGPGALVLADAAMRAGLTTEQATAALDRAAGGRGVRRARSVLGFADDGAESAGESYARAVLLGLGLPVPETQIRVDTVDGPFWGDLGWRQWRLLAEYDGQQKYGETSGDRDALVREKRREDVVRDEGWRVLRITSEDTANPASLLDRLSRVAPRGALATLTPRPIFAPRRSARTEVGGPGRAR